MEKVEQEQNMIVNNQSNIKVHFAGTETISHFWCTNYADVHYTLFTVYPFIRKKKLGSISYSDIPEIIRSNSKHTIMDSGLFTLMFGSEKGKKDKKFIYEWADKIIEFVNVSKYKGTLVEVDCQKVLGVDAAWELRKYFKQKLKNRIINVFHIEDGKKGLDEMIEFSDYIAISVPELRGLKKKHHTEKLANYIKNKKPSIDIHLLGCTEVKLLKKLKFCSSSDSTSWLQPVRFGGIDSFSNKYFTKNIDKEKLINQYKDTIYKFVKNPTDTGLLNYSILIKQCELLKNKYSIFAGNQN